MRSNEPFKPPVVESLSVRVVVDSVFDQFMPKATHPMVAIEHVGRIRSDPNSTLAGEWGLSLHLGSRQAGETGQYLLDFGYTSEVLLRNFALLGIEPERLNGPRASRSLRWARWVCRALPGPYARRSAPLRRRQGGRTPRPAAAL